jgi:hypothetical protein
MTRNITQIYFDAQGKPRWRTLDTGQFIHSLGHVRQQLNQATYTAEDLAWFRKPLAKG